MTHQDQWSKWLLETRFGGDQQAADRAMANLRGIRDEILKNAALQPGETLLDVGCGDGLVAFGALDRLGPTGRVIFSDISRPLLDQCQRIARASDALDRCEFVETPADDLGVIGDATADVVTTRSVLIYVREKARAFAEFHRVLRPGGRVSLFEPINRFGETYDPDQWIGMDVESISDLGQRLRDFYRELQPLDTDPMMDFDQHDLVRCAESAGFRTVHLTYHVLVFPAPPGSWDAMVSAPGNPNIPSLAEAMRQIFSAEERARFEEHLRPQIEAGGRTTRMASAYLTARKAGAGDA